MNKLSLLIIYVFITGIVKGQDAFPIDFLRNIILSKLTFVYIDQPQLPKHNTTASIVLSNYDIANNENLTGNFWSNTNNNASQNLVKQLLQAPQTRKDSVLQYLIGTILRIQDKKVWVYLFNDNNNSSLTRFHPSWNITDGVLGESGQVSPENTNPWVWPHAIHVIDREYTGTIHMGSAFLSKFKGGLEERMSTIIHELVHTQDNTEFVGPFRGISYGRDNSHSREELLSNYYAAYSEGLANAFEMRYRIPTRTYFQDLADNSFFRYETAPAWRCPGLPSNSCLDRYLLNSHNKPPDMTIAKRSGVNAYNEEHYKIRDLPSDVLIQNETVQAYIFYAFIHRFTAQNLALMLNRLKPRSAGNYGFPILFEEMVDACVVRSSSRGQINNSLYFPLAILDYFTGFKLINKDVLICSLRIRNTDRWTNNINDYWTSQQRGWVIDRYQNHYSNQFTSELLSDIATHFNIRQ